MKRSSVALLVGAIAACAAIVLADVWFGGYQSGLQGISVSPSAPVVLYDGQTSPVLHVVAIYSGTGATNVSASWALAGGSSQILWDSAVLVLTSIVDNAADPAIYRATLIAGYGGYTSYVNVASFSIAQNPDSDHDGIPDQWETDHGLCAYDSGDALQCWFTNGFPRAALSNNLLLFVLGKTPPSRPQYPTNFWRYTTNNWGSAGWWADSNRNGIPDGWELSYTNSLNVFTHDGDCDGDGLTDYEEYLLGTNPLDPDTDHDGVNDYWDINPLGPNPQPVAVVRYPEPGSEI